MEGGSSSHQLGDFEWFLHDIWGYGENTQIRLQDLDDKVQIVLEWYDQVAHLLNVAPPILHACMCSDILILVQHFDGNFTLGEHLVDPLRPQAKYAFVLGPSMDITPSFHSVEDGPMSRAPPNA
jgi:hypothetical protein